jgi:hypothetical protein
MAGPEPRPVAVWQRLHDNRDRNSPIFFAAGIRPGLTREVVCRSCGADEVALFWSVAGRTGDVLDLVCPVCQDGWARYDLARNRAVDPARTRLAVTGGIGLAVAAGILGTLFTLRDAPPVQILLDEVQAAADRVESALEEPGNGDGADGGAPVDSDGPAAASGGRVLVARGDRTADLDLHAARIIESRRAGEAGMLLRVDYDRARDETRVVIDSASVVWPRRLNRLRGWRHVNE